MLRHLFAHPWLLAALALLPALALLALRARAKRRRALALFGASLAGPRRGPRRLRGLCLVLGLVGLGLGLAGPRWGRQPGQATAPGRDLIVVLDDSRSMFAESPTRLEMAQAALLDLAEALRRGGGHRVGLVVFAGKARLVCPLTHDLDHFRGAVAALDLDDTDPDLEPPPRSPSGTRIGQALALAVQAHDGTEPGARDILLLSDGDDPARDGEWRDGAARAAAAGIPVHCVGLGDPDRDHPVRVRGAALRHGGAEVRTRLEEAPLREVAQRTGGELLIAGNRSLPLGEHYLRLAAGRPLREGGADVLPTYKLRYVLFLTPAFVLLAATLVIPDLRPRREVS